MDKNYTYIKRIAEYGGLTKAAQELYISTPALSKFVKAKEEELGVQLFVRDGKRFILTFAGKQYLEYQEQVQILKRSFESKIQNKNLNPNITLRVGFPLTVAKILITKIIPKFQKQYPNISLIFSEDYVSNLNQALLANKIDLIFTIDSPSLNNQSSLTTFSLATGQLALVGPSKVNLSNDTKFRLHFSYPWLEPEKVKDLPIIGLKEHNIFRNYFEEYFEKVLNAKPNVKVTLSTVEHILLAVKSGLGWAPMIDTLAQISGYRNLSYYSFGEQPQTLELQIACRKDILASAANIKFIDLCKNEVKRAIN